MTKFKFHIFSLACTFSICTLQSCFLGPPDCSGTGDWVMEHRIIRPAHEGYFDYEKTDTLNYQIRKTACTNVPVTLFLDSTETDRLNSYMPDCGAYEVRLIDCRTVAFNNPNSYGYFSMKLIPIGFSATIEFNFGVPIQREFSISMHDKAYMDTLTLNGLLYIDVNRVVDTIADTKIYYSKSRGLLKITDKKGVVFQLLE